MSGRCFLPSSAVLKDEITLRGSFVLQHQEEEAMAAVLLAGEGEYTVEISLSQGICSVYSQRVVCVTLQEKECVFLLDDKRISEINMVSGRTKKKIPKIHPFLNHVVTMASSHNGVFNRSVWFILTPYTCCLYCERFVSRASLQDCGFVDFWSQENCSCGTGIRICWRLLQRSQKYLIWLLLLKVCAMWKWWRCAWLLS